MMSDALIQLLGVRGAFLHGDPFVWDRWKWVRAVLRGGALRTLDAGCGTGAFSFYADRIGNDCVGLSFDEGNNRRAQRRAGRLGCGKVRFAQCDLRRLQDCGLAAGSFDQILCLEVIEHIQDDRAVVQELAALLKPGGRLMISTPYLHYRGLLGDRVSAVEDGGHVRWGYDLAQLRELAAQAGLQVVRVNYLSGFVSQRLTNALRSLGRWNSLLAWAAILPLRVLGFLDAPLTKLLDYPHGSIAVVAVKPEGRGGL